MYLKKCQIENFRSIKSLEVSFENNFQILVGLNESGKSNILRAISFLSPDSIPTDDDIRDPGHDEKPIILSYIRFVYGLEPCETDEVIKWSLDLLLVLQETLWVAGTKSSPPKLNRMTVRKRCLLR